MSDVPNNAVLSIFVALTPGFPSDKDRRLHYDGLGGHDFGLLPHDKVTDDYTRFVLRPSGSQVDPKGPSGAHAIQCIVDGNYMHSNGAGQALDSRTSVLDGDCRFRFIEVMIEVAGNDTPQLYYYIQVNGTQDYLRYTGGDGLQPSSEGSLFYVRLEAIPPHQHFVPTGATCTLISFGNGRNLHVDGLGGKLLGCPDPSLRDLYTKFIIEVVEEQGVATRWRTIRCRGEDHQGQELYLKVRKDNRVIGVPEVDIDCHFEFVESVRRPGTFHILGRKNGRPIHANSGDNADVDMPFTLAQLDDNYLLFRIQLALLDRWMSGLPSDLRVMNTTIPGSHDSACYHAPDGMGLSADLAGAITQSGSCADQLNAGVRYFDLRTKLHSGEVYLHHSSVLGEKLAVVLSEQIVPFLEAHPGELVFLDLQLDDRSPTSEEHKQILTLLSKIPKAKIASEHLTQSADFRPQVTWGDLRAKERQVIVTWNIDVTLTREEDGTTPWISNRCNLRWSPYGDFDEKLLPEILRCLDKYVAKWRRCHGSRLFVAQVIDSPGSFSSPKPPSPLMPPGDYEALFGGDLNKWVTEHLYEDGQPFTPPKLNIVLRDFVNQYPALMAEIILQNPLPHLGES